MANKVQFRTNLAAYRRTEIAHRLPTNPILPQSVFFSFATERRSLSIMESSHAKERFLPVGTMNNDVTVQAFCHKMEKLSEHEPILL